jgi:hypothetical protein
MLVQILDNYRCVCVGSVIDVSEVPACTVFKGPQFAGWVGFCNTDAARFDPIDGGGL